MKHANPPTLHIIGAGISGLHCAYQASKLGIKCKIFEKSDHCGGLIQTQNIEGLGIVESAANGILSNHEVEILAEELQLTLIPAKETSKNRFLLRKQKLLKWPLNFLETLEFVACIFRSLFRWKPKTYETLHQWSERVCGPSFSQHVLFPALQGVYARDPSQLSASLIFRRFFHPLKNPEFKKRKQKYRGSLSFRGGMFELIKALEQHLIQVGCEFHFSTPVSEVLLEEWKNQSIPVIISTPLHITRGLLKNMYPIFYRVAEPVESVDLISATLFFKEAQNSWLEGFGVLIPRSERFDALGVLNPHEIFDGRLEKPSQQKVETWIFKDEIMRLSDEQILSLIQEERQRLSANAKAEILSYRIFRWPRAIPYYSVSLERLLEHDAYKSFEKENIRFVGNWTGALSLSQMLASQRHLVRDFVSQIVGSAT